MGKKISALGLIALSLASITGAAIIWYWQSGYIGKTITVKGVSAWAIDVGIFANYGSKTLAIGFYGYDDIRGNSFVVALDTNLAQDMVVKLDAIGVPVGMVISVKMAFVSFYTSSGQGDRIWAFGSDGVYNINNAIYISSDSTPWKNPSFSGMINVPININGVGSDVYTLAQSNIAMAKWRAVTLPADTNPQFSNCNGMWFKITFDTSGMGSLWGDFTIQVRVSLGSA